MRTSFFTNMLASSIRLLRSPRLATAAMISSLLALVIWVVPFILYGVPTSRVRAILYDEPFGRALLISLAVTAAFCTMPRVWSIGRRIARVPKAGQNPRHAGGGVAVDASFRPETAGQALAKAGFRRVVVSDDWCWGVKRPYALAGSLIFHLALLFIALGAGQAVLSDAAFSGKFLLTEGQAATIAPDQYFETQGTADGPTVDLRLEDIETAFHEDVLLFTALKARIVEDGTTKRVSVGHPVYLGPETLLRLGDFGWALEVSEGSDSATETQTFALKVFPPGSQDEFTIGLGGGEYRVVVKAYGDYVSRDGEPGVDSFNLSEPAAEVSVWRVMTNGEETLVVDSAIVPVPGVVDVRGTPLNLVAVRQYGVFTVSRTPGSALLLVGLALAFAGATIRLLMPRVEGLVLRAGSGSLVTVNADVYRSDPASVRAIVEALRRGEA